MYSEIDQGVYTVSIREKSQTILNSMTEEQLSAFVSLFESAFEIPNTETINAINEIESGKGTVFTGSTEDFFEQLLGDNNA